MKQQKSTMTGALKRIKDKDDSLGTFIEKFNGGLGKVLFGTEDSKPLSFENQISVLGIQGINFKVIQRVQAAKLTQKN